MEDKCTIVDRAIRSIGTLGGGNHFIEIDVDESGDYYLVIHSGSRNLGVQVCEFWQQKAIDCAKSKLGDFKTESESLIAMLKEEGRQKEIPSALKALKQKYKDNVVDENLAYVEKEDLAGYLHDMKIAQKYAELNRKAIQEEIIDILGLQESDILGEFCTIHNYIDLDRNIVRKGAIRLEKDELAIIPGSMAYGSLIVKGKGNPDWNYSGPHGFGRKYSRKKAKEALSMEDFKQCMEGVYSTSVVEDTLDEAPMAYKDPESVISNIGDTCDIVTHIKPIWNIKALS